MHALQVHPNIGDGNLSILLGLAKNVIGIFSVIFLFYTYSFLMKRRKKELGLLNILGMEKKHIAKVLFVENVYLLLSSLIVGLLSGLLFNKLIFMLLNKIVQVEIMYEGEMLQYEGHYQFYLAYSSMLVTAVLFAGIYLLLFIYSILQVHLTNPIQLLKGGKVGEKEPKTRWILAIIGVLTLGAGYTIALTVESPMAAIGWFFFAVILVMMGTYALFTAGSIAFLKLLRRNKGYYYQTKHFISVSGMLYRMKQNAVGLANICLLSTAVLVVVSSTVSLYIGVDDILRERFPRNVMIQSYGLNDSQEKQAELRQWAINTFEEKESPVSNLIDGVYTAYPAIKKGDQYTLTEQKGQMNFNELVVLNLISTEDYNRMEGKNISLADDEVLFHSENGNKQQKTVEVGTSTWQIKETIPSFEFAKLSLIKVFQMDYVIMNDPTSVPVPAEVYQPGQYVLGFDLEQASEQELMELVGIVEKKIAKSKLDADVESVAGERAEFYILYGGLFFIGIFLGLLCLIATVLIIYYKQVSEGYEDRARFEILQKVGMSQKEVKQTIKSQILMVFFLPLLMAVIHIAFAFPIVNKLLNALNLNNITLFLLCTVITVIIFGLFYSLVYFLTAKTYYKIVRTNEDNGR